MSTIPTYNADGQRLRNYPLSSIEWLLSHNEVAVERNRKGRIVCAHFREGGSNPIRATAHMGQHYSFEQQLPSGRTAWRHSPLLQRADKKNLMSEGFNSEQVDRFVRDIFRTVLASCLMKQEDVERHGPAKVVSIDTARQRRQPARPLEFDSEYRRAA